MATPASTKARSERPRADCASRSLLNMASMRSVIRKPPTTLVAEQQTAMKPSMILSQSCISPTTTREPISEMPEMALVADISGVCSRGGTREMTWMPRKPARRKMYRPTSSGVIVMAVAFRCSGAGGSLHCLVDHLALVRHQRAARQLVVQVQLHLSVLDEVRQERRDGAGVHLAGVQRHRAGQVHRPADDDAVPNRVLARLG